MTEDDEPPPTDEMPKDLAAALRRNARARTAFEAMPPSHRRRYVGWVTEAKARGNTSPKGPGVDPPDPRVGGPARAMNVGTAPAEVRRPTSDEVNQPDLPWIVIVWNDPINLMSYVTWVFMRLFGYPREKAEKLMWDVHTKGRAVVSSGPREKAESDVARLHAHGLWATLEHES